MDKTDTTYTLDDLLYLMKRLRDPVSGCPWDLKQNYQTIAPSTLEEAYEVVDAIETEDYPQLKEELGDLIFQSVFYAQIASEEQRFDFHDVIHGITEKLIQRHPHVFPNGMLTDELPMADRQEGDDFSAQWEALKSRERKDKGYHGILDDIPVSLPATSRAIKLQKRASSVGFDWNNIISVLEKVDEELAEVREAIELSSQSKIEEELGDLMFMVANTCRHLKIDPETALRGANRKFERRFGFIESELQKCNRDLEGATIDEMEALWDEAKSRGL